jgi:hypothetical protein
MLNDEAKPRTAESVRGTVEAYIARGWEPVAIPALGKRPHEQDWGIRTYIPEDFGTRHNIGIKLGGRSQGLTDVDLDCDEAVALAPYILPPTDATFGRDGNTSHYIYQTGLWKTEDKGVTAFLDPSTEKERRNQKIIELRTGGNGKAIQTVFPGSIYVDMGDPQEIRWSNGAGPVPAEVDGAELKVAVARLAAAVVLTREWPREKGKRHDFALVVGGVLARAGWDREDAGVFVGYVAQCAKDEEFGDRGRAAASCCETLKKGDGNVFGLPTLRERLGIDVANRIAEWLGLRRETRVASGKKLGSLLQRLDNEVEAWRGERDEPFVTVRDGLAHANYKVSSRRFRTWLSPQVHEALGAAPKRDDLESIVRHFEAKAYRPGAPLHKTWVRVARSDSGLIYLDICNEAWEAVEVGPMGWRVVQRPPVKFRRPENAQPLPLPQPHHDGGVGVWEFGKFFRTDKLELFVSVLVSYLVPDIPYVVLYLTGRAGSSKTTTAKFIVQLIDPQTAETPGQCNKEDDLMVAAQNRHVLISDNVTAVKPNMIDAYCRLATGGGLEKRAHYTNEESHAINVRRPQVFTGINPGVDREDFVDRMLSFDLGEIEPEARRPEAEVREAFMKARPWLLGLLLDGLSRAMRDYEVTKQRLATLPRLADFMIYAEAASSAYGWKEGEVQKEYDMSMQERLADAADATPLVGVVVKFLGERPEWQGEPQMLYDALYKHINHEYRFPSDILSKSPVHLIRRLNEKKKLLETKGICFDCQKVVGGDRLIRLWHSDWNRHDAPNAQNAPGK